MKKFILALMGLWTAAAMYAIPARPGFNKVTQPDGTVIELQRMGDESFSYFITRDGKPMQRDKDGFFRYVTVRDGKVNFTGDASAASSSRAYAGAVKYNRKTLRRVSPEVRTDMPSRSDDPEIPQFGLGLYSGNFPRQGKIRSLVFLVEFQDTKFSSPDATRYFKNLFNQEGFSENGNYGSVHDYFHRQSNGKFDIEFDVYGPVTLKHDTKYYGEDVVDRGVLYRDDLAYQMAVEATEKFDGEIDFSRYDYDGDGHIDNIFIVYAGYGQADADYNDPDSEYLIWPHAYNVYWDDYPEEAIYLDGKILDGYCCVNELDNYGTEKPEEYNGTSNMNCIGTFVHEFSHVLGLPDLYMTDYDDDYTGYYETPGYFSVMDVNTYATMGRYPAAYGAFERNALGWSKPRLISAPGDYTLDEIQDSDEFYLIQTEREREFFLLENRQNVKYDRGIPGHGMLVWHIEFNQTDWDWNRVNNTPGHNMVDIVKAGGRNNYYRYGAEYPFPGTKKVTSLTAATTPALVSWAKKPLAVGLKDIAESDGVITFKAVADMKTITPVVKDAVSASRTEIEFSWEPVFGATRYYLTAGTATAGGSETRTYDFTGGAPAGWTFGGNTVSDIFGKGAPSLGFTRDGNTLTTEVFTTPVRKVAFWLKGGSRKEKFRVDGRGSADGEWTEIKSLETLYTASTSEVEVPAGIVQLRFVYEGTMNRCYMDDLAIELNSSEFTPFDGYDRRDVGNVTTFKAPINTDAEKVIFYVTAADEDGTETNQSAPGTITFDLSGLENVEADFNAPVEYFNLQGLKVENPGPGIYIRRQGSKVTKVVIAE